jgi:hypothetical protein
MRRKRPFPGRFPPPGRRRPGLPPRRKPVPPVLERANRLFANGEYLEAARLYEDLAEKARGPRIFRKPVLFLQAGRCLLYGNEAEAGVRLFQKGFSILKQQQRWGDLQRLARRALAELREKGYEEQASQLEEWLASQAIPSEVDMKTSTVQEGRKLPPLPLTCPACGGAVHPDEVDWSEDMSVAECSYCGNLLRAEVD